jgi:hypothetical protein
VIGLNVGELIAELKKYDRGSHILIDKSPIGLAPKAVDSYRGYYEDLAINVEPDRHSMMRAGDFLSLLEERLGTTMTGYKGGEYRIRPTTRVWVSNYGENSGARVTGLRLADWGCVYITWESDRED